METHDNPEPNQNPKPLTPAETQAIVTSILEKNPKPPATYDQNPADAIIPTDKICYESEDGLVRIDQLVYTTEKFPPSRYPCIVLLLKQEAHTRVRQIGGGYIEFMPTFKEMEELVIAMNNVGKSSGKGQLYQILQTVPEKTKRHKQKWREFNEARLGIRPKPGKWWWGKRKQYSKHGKN